MSTVQEIQKNYFEKLKRVFPEIQLSNIVASVLNISTGEAYKKISGKSFLNIEQIVLLSNHFQVVFEYMPFIGESKAMFTYSNFMSGSNSIENYLNSIHKTLSFLKSERSNSITSTSDEIPLFHLFKYPELAAFKIYYWESRQSKTKNSGRKAPFSFTNTNMSLIEKCYQMHREYNQIASTEIWAKNAVQNTLLQIAYAEEAHFIPDKSLLKILYEQIENTIYDVEAYSINGMKAEPEDPVVFNWSICENIASTCWLFKTTETFRCYQRFNTFNTLQTSDIQYCEEVDQWIGNVFKESTGISGQSERERNAFVSSNVSIIKGIVNEIQ